MDEDGYLTIGIVTIVLLIFLFCISFVIRYYLRNIDNIDTNEYSEV